MSSEDRKGDAPLSEGELRVALGRAANSGGIELSSHAKKRARERNISVDDFIHALRYSGWVQDAAAEFDEERKNWKYSIASQDIEGDALVLKIALKYEGELVEVITAW